jgi:outer membrane biogenesis lipoprotein LolB
MIRIIVPIIALLLLAACDTLTRAGTNEEAAMDGPPRAEPYYRDGSGD